MQVYPGAHINGRHHSACLRRIGAPVAVVSCSAAEAAAGAPLAPARPIVPWL